MLFTLPEEEVKPEAGTGGEEGEGVSPVGVPHSMLK
jgi:hypothetical protein